MEWNAKRGRGLLVEGNVHKLPDTDDIIFKRALALVENDRCETALNIVLELIDRGYGHANTLAGYIYENGGEGVGRNFERAFFYYKQAANTVGAMHGWLGMARLLSDGRGVDRDLESAFECYSVVSEDAGSPIAWINLGRMHKEGAGTLKNIALAKEYFERASEAGYVVADVELAELARESGGFVRFLVLRAKAGVRAMTIAYRDEHDARLMEK